LEGGVTPEEARPQGVRPEPTHSPPPVGFTPEPTQSLPPEARRYFILQALGWTVPLAIAGVVGGAALGGAAGIAIIAVTLTVAVAGAVPLPLIRWRTWRYEVREEELDLLRGALVVTRTLIPMTRVQHVDTRRTVISDLFELRAVVVHTAAESHEIPALRPGEAATIRDRIAHLARTPDDV
jgi:hypothetical protein